MSTELLSFMQRERAPIIAQENLSPSPSFRVDISSYSGRQSIDSSASSSSSTNCSLTSGMSSGSDKNYHSHHIASQSKMSSSNNFSIDMLIAKATNHDSTNKHSPTSLPWNGLPAQNLIDLKRIQQYQQMLSKSCEMNPLVFSNYPTAEPNPLAMFAEYQQGLASLSHPVSSVAHLGMNTNDLVSYYASLYNSSAAAVSLQYLQRLKHYTSLFSSTASAATPSSAASSLFGLSSSKAIPSSSSVSSLITTATSTSQSSNATSTTTTESASVKSAHHNEFDVSKRLVTPQLQSTTPNTVTTTTTTSSSSVSSRDAHSSTPTTPFCDYNSLLLNPSVAAVGLIAAASVAGSVAKSSQSQSMVNVQNSLVVGGDKSLSNHSNYSQRSLIEQGILSEMSEIQRSKVNPTDHHNQNEELYPGSGTDSPPLPPSTPTSAHHGESAFNQLFRKPKRIRTAFSPGQLLRLEEIFEKNRYVVGCERKQLARDLNLSETQIKVWFQNRRTKHKREKSFGPESQNMKFMNVSRTINNNS